MASGAAYSWLHRVWYEDGRFGWLLLPFSWLYAALVGLRRFLYEQGILRSHRANAPVVVVGNITAGGTGKTPIVLWLVNELRARGLRPHRPGPHRRRGV